MRKATTITAILLAFMMAVSLCGCGQSESGSAEETGTTQPQQEEAVQDGAVQEDMAAEDGAAQEGAEAGLLLLEVNGQTLEVELEDNEAAQTLKEQIGAGGMQLDLEEYGGFEKVGPLPESLPANDEQMDTSPGDIVLYQGNQISLFYGENSWSYTRLGHVKDMDGAQLQEILGDGDVSVVLKLGE